MDISKLVEQAKCGSNKSFDKLYKLTEKDIWFTCISFLKNETNAQDIMQETYITAFVKINSLDKTAQFKSWLNKIAVNKCKDYLKGKGEIQLSDEILENTIVQDELTVPEEYIANQSKRDCIISLMQKALTDVQYQTVIMYYFNEMSVAEIAEFFECSKGTVLSRLNYSRAKMKTAIEDYEKESGDKLHGVVLVPFFSSIFKEEAKSKTVPNIKIELPNGHTIATTASNAFATSAKSITSALAKVITAMSVKTKVLAIACGFAVLVATPIGIGVLVGCNTESSATPDEVTTTATATDDTVQTTTISSDVAKAIEDNGLKIDKEGNITDKEGNKVEVKDGTVEVKTDDGKTVTVKVEEVKATVSGNSNTNTNTNTNKGSDTSKTETSKADTSKAEGTTVKPTTKPNTNTNTNTNNSSSNIQTTTKDPHEGKTYHEAEYKYYKHHEKVTKYHESEWVVTGSHEEDVYNYGYIDVCNFCGCQLAGANFRIEHLLYEAEANPGTNAGTYHCEKQWVKVGTKTVEDGYWTEAWAETISEAYDEEVSVNDDWDRKELVKEAGWY